MSVTKEDYSLILQNRNHVFHLINYTAAGPERKDYLVVDLFDFHYKKVRINEHERIGYENNFNYLIYNYDRKSIIMLCKLKIYALGIELFMKPDYIDRMVKIWVSWISRLPVSTSFALLRLDAVAIFPDILNN